MAVTFVLNKMGGRGGDLFVAEETLHWILKEESATWIWSINRLVCWLIG